MIFVKRIQHDFNHWDDLYILEKSDEEYIAWLDLENQKLRQDQDIFYE